MTKLESDMTDVLLYLALHTGKTKIAICTALAPQQTIVGRAVALGYAVTCGLVTMTERDSGNTYALTELGAAAIAPLRAPLPPSAVTPRPMPHRIGMMEIVQCVADNAGISHRQLEDKFVVGSDLVPVTTAIGSALNACLISAVGDGLDCIYALTDKGRASMWYPE